MTNRNQTGPMPGICPEMKIETKLSEAMPRDFDEKTGQNVGLWIVWHEPTRPIHTVVHLN